MAHPKRRKSKSKKNKRRTHYKLIKPQLSFDIKNQKYYLSHKAYWNENKLYYKGKIIFKKKKKI